MQVQLSVLVSSVGFVALVALGCGGRQNDAASPDREGDATQEATESAEDVGDEAEDAADDVGDEADRATDEAEQATD